MARLLAGIQHGCHRDHCVVVLFRLLSSISPRASTAVLVSVSVQVCVGLCLVMSVACFIVAACKPSCPYREVICNDRIGRKIRVKCNAAPHPILGQSVPCDRPYPVLAADGESKCAFVDASSV